MVAELPSTAAEPASWRRDYALWASILCVVVAWAAWKNQPPQVKLNAPRITTPGNIVHGVSSLAAIGFALAAFRFARWHERIVACVVMFLGVAALVATIDEWVNFGYASGTIGNWLDWL